MKTIIALVVVTCLLTASGLSAHAQGTVFTYQGQLASGGSNYTGVAEIAPTLWDAVGNGNQVGTNNPTSVLVGVTNGLFSMALDFGSAPFTAGAPRWLEFGVRTNLDPFTTLSPRQPLTAVPYAITASYVTMAGNATTFSGSLAGDITGTQSGTVVSAVGGQTAASVATGVTAANAATSANTANTIVKRDGSGNFSANAITAGSLSGNGAGLTNLAYANLTGTPVIPSTNGLATTNFVLSQGYLKSANGGNAALATNVVLGIGITNAFITNSVFAGNGAGLTSLNASNLTGTVPLAQLSGITSNQLDPATWQYLVALASGLLPAPSGMALIPAGAFTMGDTLDGMSDAVPVTNVYISAFYMDINLVSYSLWTNVYIYATNHGYLFVHSGAGKAYNHPVQSVDWYDCVKWCNARSQQAGKTPVYYTDAGLTQIYTNGEVTVYPNWSAKGYRLPTEAEWEKAARGGLSGQRFPWGNTISESQANYYGAAGGFGYDLGPTGYNSIGSVGGTSPATSPVGSFAPNGYGLNDMAGNVFAWCWDWYGTPYVGGVNPTGLSSGMYRVMRGGSWGELADKSRTACRNYDVGPLVYSLNRGFRSVLPAGQ